MAQITLNVAAIVSIIIESILYGISIFMFLWTLWALFNNKSTRINKVMLTVTGILFISGTAHIIVNSRRAYLGFIVSEIYFVNNVFNVIAASIYGTETLVADAVLIYRCYIIWRDFRIIILPIILWLSTIVTAVHTIWSIVQPVSAGEGVFLNETARWVISFYSIALATNIIPTVLLAYRLWHVNAAVSAATGPSEMFTKMNPKVRSVLLVVMECGALYSFSLVTMLGIYFGKSFGAYVMINIIPHIITITFYVIIIRTSLHRLTDKQKLTIYDQQTSIHWVRPTRSDIGRVEEVILPNTNMDSASTIGATHDGMRLQFVDSKPISMDVN